MTLGNAWAVEGKGFAAFAASLHEPPRGDGAGHGGEHAGSSGSWPGKSET